MNVNNGGGASFFKILLDVSKDRLPLPPAFAKKHLKTRKIKKQTVVLKIKSGVKGTVTYSNIKDEYYFKDGWLKFMKNNGLKVGVFLVFWLLSPSPTLAFQVFVYEPNGCLKLKLKLKQATMLNNANVIEETSDDDSLEIQQQKMTRVITESCLYRLPMKNSFIDNTGISGYSSVRLKNEEGKIWKVTLNTYNAPQKQKVTRLTRGWCHFRKDNKIVLGDTCEFYHVKANLFRVRVLTT